MNTMIEPLVAQFGMQGRFFSGAIDGITEEDALHSAGDSTNHIAWLAGHLLSCRYMLGGIIGMNAEEPYTELFGNLKGIDRSASYPTLDKIENYWSVFGAKFIEKLSGVTDEDLKGQAPMGDGKLIDLVTFFAYHEGYHIGQIGLLRKHLGYEALSHG